MDFAEARERMVERQLRRRGIADERVLAAMGAVPRERFLPADLASRAHADAALPIDSGQTISQPYIVACMAEAAALGPDDTVLEIGTGSGYAAAVLARLAGRVVTVERHAPLAELARQRLADLGCDNVDVYAADGMLGMPSRAPFDAILCAAAGISVPQAWKDQLAIGGRLVMPVGPQGETQDLVKLTRLAEHDFARESLGGVRFVPLLPGMAK